MVPIVKHHAASHGTRFCRMSDNLFPCAVHKPHVWHVMSYGYDSVWLSLQIEIFHFFFKEACFVLFILAPRLATYFSGHLYYSRAVCISSHFMNSHVARSILHTLVCEDEVITPAPTSSSCPMFAFFILMHRIFFTVALTIRNTAFLWVACRKAASLDVD